MKILQRFWQRLTEEKYAMRAMNISITMLSLYTVLFTSISPPFAWMVGALNGSMWLIDIFNDDND